MIQDIVNRLEKQIAESLLELELIDQKRAEKVKSSKEYSEYIKSKEWQETRQRIFKRDNYKCQKCGTAKNLSVHHITYENLGEEKDADLVTLCESCHGDIHGIPHYSEYHSSLLKARDYIREAENEILNAFDSGDSCEKEIARAYLTIIEKAKKEANEIIRLI